MRVSLTDHDGRTSAGVTIDPRSREYVAVTGARMSIANG
jgi:hypothetical protein